MTAGKGPLIAEFLLLFVAAPLLLRLQPVRHSPVPALWLASLYCLLVLRSTAGFQPQRLWNAQPLAHSLPSVLALFALAAMVATLLVWRLRPQLLFSFPRTRPLFWAAVMLLYPVLSVYPQGIIYRVFFFERYRPLFPGTAALIVASAAAFGFAHIIFRSPWPVVLTFFAGLLFAWRYEATGSLLVSSLEHALWGCFAFTAGLGHLFYHGPGRWALRG